jgi:hypothetical protein
MDHMWRAVLVVLFVMVGIVSPSGPQGTKRFDLAKIRETPGCAAKGRLQDRGYNDSKVVEQIIRGGKDSIPILISQLTEEKRIHPPVFCFWNETTTGDVAFVMLTDLFTDSTWTKATIPEASWDALLDPAPDTPGIYQLSIHVRKYGRKSVQKKWKEIWEKYKDQVVWDPRERCFKLKSSG